MSVPVHVDGYSGWKANERPQAFELDGVYHRIYAVEDQWHEPEARYFKVRADGKTYMLRHDEREDEWTLQSGFDGDELLARPDLQLIPIDVPTIRQSEALIESCEHCHSNDAEIPFDFVLAEVAGMHGHFEFILEEPARCPTCKQPVSEKTLVDRRDLYDFAKDDAFDVERFRARLRKMTDEQLIEHGRAGRYLCSPKAYWGRAPREVFVIQLRRKPLRNGTGGLLQSKADLSDKPTSLELGRIGKRRDVLRSNCCYGSRSCLNKASGMVLIVTTALCTCSRIPTVRHDFALQ
jgi:hypothetical protein